MRFVFVTDSHVGAGATGYTQQPRDPALLQDVVAALGTWIGEHPDVEFVLHGGDIVDTTSAASIGTAVEVFAALPVPTYLCLGNHDLTMPDAPAAWLRLAPHFFPTGTVDYTLESEDAVVHVVPNHWTETDHSWSPGQPQVPRLTPAQEHLVTAHAAAGRDVVLATHSPVFGVPAAQIGLDADYHVPPVAFRDAVTTVAAASGASLVLSGHNHINSLTRHAGCVYVTGSALAETPYEFKDVRVGGRDLSIRTRSLLEQLPDGPAYNFDRTFVQGRFVDRVFRSNP